MERHQLAAESNNGWVNKICQLSSVNLKNRRVDHEKSAPNPLPRHPFPAR